MGYRGMIIFNPLLKLIMIANTASTPRQSRTLPTFHYKRISWPAIFAGSLIALGIQLLLSLLGIGIGMGTIDPIHERNPMAGLGMGTFIWWVATFLISLYVGGWVAGKLSRTMNKFESVMHGILSWVVFVIFNVYLLTNAAGSLINTAGGILGSTTSLAGQTAIARSSASTDPSGEDGNIIATDMERIQNELDQLKARQPEMEAKARRVADDIASSLSKAGIYAFISLLLGAIISGLAANIGRGNNYVNEYEAEEGPNQHYPYA